MLPIVLVHGFPLDARMWASQAAFLRGLGRVVMTPDLPGFGGRVALGREETSMEAFAREVHRVIVREAGGKAIVGGFSMGGYVLQALLRDHPESVAAAMFICTRAEADAPAVHDGRMKAAEEVARTGTAGLIDAMLGKVMAKQPSPTVKAQVRAIMESQFAEGVACAQLAMARRRDQTDLLSGLKIPVLILVGAEDAVSPPSVALGMQACVPSAMLVQIAAAGHMAPMEQPAAVNAAIETFLATIHC